MKLSVAFSLVTTIALSVSVGQGQTKRSAAKGSPSKPRTETMKICQGVPIPDGYVIIAYMTSSVCSHGAYILKKQADYENSLAVNGSGRQPEGGSAQPTGTSTSTTGNSAKQTSTSAQTERGAAPSARASASVSRPRRVATPQTQNEPPTLIGAQTAAPLGPPTLAGTRPVGEPVGSPGNTESVTGPEEVGEGDVVRVDTTLVTVPVSVLDRQGRFVPNLRREDFSVFENGVEQSIAYFEPSEKPFTVALLLDTSASTHFHLPDIRAAAIAFAKQLRPQDRVIVVSFADEVLLLTEATNDLDTIETVIEEYANPGNSTRLYDAVDLVINERLNKVNGRKAIVLFTDGVDTSSRLATYQSTLREAEELDALIYPIQYDTTDYLRAMQGAGAGSVTIVTRRNNWPFGSSTSQQTYTLPGNNGAPLPGSTSADYQRADLYLHALADKTGGRLYQANDTAQLEQAFTRIAEELGRQYSLGYYPKSPEIQASDRRQIRVRVRQPDLAVKARDSYVKANSPDPNK